MLVKIYLKSLEKELTKKFMINLHDALIFSISHDCIIGII